MYLSVRFGFSCLVGERLFLSLLKITCSTSVMLVFFSDGVRKDVTPINMQLHGEGKQEVFCWQKKLLDSFCWILKVFVCFLRVQAGHVK